MKAVARKLAAIPILLFAFQSCATNHLINWGQGRPSIWSQASEDDSAFVRPTGAILAMPVTLAWDVLTFPVQWFWDIHPYGPEFSPESQDYVSSEGYVDSSVVLPSEPKKEN